jgi:hypothetical protein
MDKQERNDEVTKKDAPGLSNWIGSSDALKGQAAATSPEDVSTSGVRPQSEGSSLEPVHKKHRHEGIAVSKVSSEKDEKGQTRRVELQAVAAAKKAYKSTLLKRDREKKRRDQFKKGLEKLTGKCRTSWSFVFDLQRFQPPQTDDASILPDSLQRPNLAA